MVGRDGGRGLVTISFVSRLPGIYLAVCFSFNIVLHFARVTPGAFILRKIPTGGLFLGGT